MKTELRKIHRRIRYCKKCYDILKKNALPRSGFPPKDNYEAVIIGAEPGHRAKSIKTPTPSEYKKSFMPGTKNTNRIRLLFEDLESGGIDHSIFFYTNAVKCPANPREGEPIRCIKNCGSHLNSQLAAINPKLIIVIGNAAKYLGLKKATKNSIERSKYMGVPVIIIRHPQAASIEYRKKVIKGIKSILKKKDITFRFQSDSAKPRR